MEAMTDRQATQRETDVYPRRNTELIEVLIRGPTYQLIQIIPQGASSLAKKSLVCWVQRCHPVLLF